MNRKQALARLKKRIKNVGWRENVHNEDAAGRAKAHELAVDLRAVQRAIKAEVDARRAELLADPRYVELLRRYDDARKRADNASAASRRFPITVGRLSDGAGLSFFHVLAEGDTWDEVVAKVEAES